MVKHTQTIRRQQPTNCLSVFDHFVEFALKGLNSFDETWVGQNLLDQIQFTRFRNHKPLLGYCLYLTFFSTLTFL